MDEVDSQLKQRALMGTLPSGQVLQQPTTTQPRARHQLVEELHAGEEVGMCQQGTWTRGEQVVD